MLQILRFANDLEIIYHGALIRADNDPSAEIKGEVLLLMVASVDYDNFALEQFVTSET